MRNTGPWSIPITLAVATLALLATAGSAAAATIPIKGGEVGWGIKASFRSYIESPAAAGKIELSGGAVEAADGTYKFPVELGSYDLTTHATEVQSKGSVYFTGHYTGEDPALAIAVADPRLVLEGEGGAVFADVTSKSLMTGETVSYPGVEFAVLDTSGVAPSFKGEALSLAGIPAELTAEGAEAFAGFYTGGAALDPIGVLASFAPTPPPAEEEKKSADPKPEGPKSQDPPKSDGPAPDPVLPLPTLKKATGGAAMLGGGGAAKVATISCPTAQACTLQAPRKVMFKAGGKQWSAKVIAPHWILPGKSGKVAVKVPRAALPHLADGKAKISLKLVLGVGTQSQTQVVKVTLKVRGVAGNGVVKVGEVPCGAAPCTLRAPSRVKVKIGGEGFRARVVLPRRVAAHTRATVRVKLGPKAVKDLAGATAQVSVRVVVRAAGEKSVRVVRAMITRPASTAPGGSGGGAPIPAAPPASAPIEGEPPVLARPATAVTVSGVQLSWMPRDSWVRYVSSATAAEGGIAPGAGATGVQSTASPCPDRPSSASVPLTYQVNFPAKESWYDPLTGQAGIYGTGNVAFRWAVHSINLTASEPELEINGPSSRAIFRFSGSGGTPYPNQRVAVETLETSGRPTVSPDGKTLTYSLMRGRLTPDGEKVFAGFYTAPSDNEFGCLSTTFTLP